MQKDNSKSDTVWGLFCGLAKQRGTPPGNVWGGVLWLELDIVFETGEKEKLVKRD